MSTRSVCAALLDGGRTSKPRTEGITVVLDVGEGLPAIEGLAGVAGSHWDYVKIAWGSALITDNLEAKLALYRKHDITPMFGGTLFEYAYLRGKADLVLDLARETKVHVEISDGVANIPRAEKLQWIERFAKHVQVFSELGGKQEQQALDWRRCIREEREAGALKIVIEGREIGPVGAPIQEDLVNTVCEASPQADLVFEALERPQQVWLIKHLGPNVNLANIRPAALLTLESFRRGLKEHTLLHKRPQKA